MPNLWRYIYALTAGGVYYMRAVEANRSGLIEYLTFKSGAVKVIAKTGTPDLGFDVSPDGRYLIYSQRERTQSDLMLVENFR